MEENKEPELPEENKPDVEQNENEGDEIIPAEETAIPEMEQSEIPPLSGTEPLTSNEPSTLNLEPLTNEMEVHHHGHVHETKKWKEYVFQFLMLFLAVFCGFLAEYKLEHVIEHNREKQFINSLVADLEDDTKVLDIMITEEIKGTGRLDTLITLLNNSQLAKQHGDQLYFVARMGPRYLPFANNSRTFDQLKFSGGFRLIRNQEASNKIMDYYNQFSLLRLMEDNYNHEFDNYKNIAAKILDPGILRRQENDNGEILRSTDNPVLRTYDMELMKEMGFHALQMNGSRRSKLLILETLKRNAEELMAYLKREYKLK